MKTEGEIDTQNNDAGIKMTVNSQLDIFKNQIKLRIGKLKRKFWTCT